MLLFALLIVSAVAPFTTASIQARGGNEGSNLLLKPAAHPQIDRSDVANLKATKNAALHYDSNSDPGVDSTVVTISAPVSQYPLVQLENTDFIKSVDCSSGTARIVFSDQNAFKAAAQDWQSHQQFIFTSHVPSCGDGSTNNQGNFALANGVTTDASSMTVSASIRFVDFEEAMGDKTPLTTSIGQYVANDSHAVEKRASKSKTITWKEYPTNQVSDPKWGTGFQLYSGSNLQLVCVNCGTEGSVTLTGTVNWTTSDGITNAELIFGGSMSVKMDLGVDAQGISDTIPIGNMNLAQVALAGIEIPKIMTLGPQLDISASASVTISATGSMLVGATLNWPSLAATLVLEGGGSTGGSGWSPSFQPVSNVEGTISAKLDVNLPVELGVGINLLNGKYNKTAGVVDTPTLGLTAAASNTGPCQGVGLNADFANNVNADVFGLTTIPIASYSTALFSTCLGSGTSPPTTTPTPGAASRHPAEKVRNGRRYRQVM